MPDIRAIIAIGSRGQLGLHGHLPWEGDTRAPFREDVARFFDIVRGHVLIAGPKTIASVPDAARARMLCVVARSAEAPRAVLERFAGRVVYIGGGPTLWDAYAPFIRHWDINRLPYDGEADRWFDPQWLVAGHAEV